MTSSVAWTAQILAPDYAFQTLTLETLALTMDENWAPYTQASLTVTYTPQLENLNPEAADIYVTLTATQSFGRSYTLDDLSALYTGKTLDDLSTLHTGKTLDDLSTLHYVGFDTTTAPPAVTRSWTLCLRELTIDYKTQTAHLALASAESRLQDFALVANAPLTPVLPWNQSGALQDNQPAALATYVLAQIGLELLEADNTFDPYKTYWTAAQLVWQPGQTAFDYVYNLLRRYDILLYCRFDGRFVLRNSRRYYGDTIPTTTLDATNLKTAEITRSRQADNYTAAVITYTWLDGSGNRQTAVDSYDSGVIPKKVYTEAIDVASPGAGIAQQVFNNLKLQARTLEATAVVDLSGTWLSGIVNLTHAKGTFNGYLRKVQFQHPSDEMQLTIRQG